MGVGPEIAAEIERLDEELYTVFSVLEAYGLTRVKDTFVGDQQTVRGVSGGEKKRVTVAEMSVGSFPILCMVRDPSRVCGCFLAIFRRIFEC
jgi:ABC-type multidrug transport system ATPase subunit